MTKYLGIIIIVAALGIGGVYAYQHRTKVSETNQPNNQLGGDRDAHGCIGSAGYTWSEPKQKCVRPWEEPVFDNTQQEIAYLLSQKYNKKYSDVHVTVTKEVPGYAYGSVLFGAGGPGESGMWLAYSGNGWHIAWDGNGDVDCSKMRSQYGFPDTILKPNFCRQ